MSAAEFTRLYPVAIPCGTVVITRIGVRPHVRAGQSIPEYLRRLPVPGDRRPALEYVT